MVTLGAADLIAIIGALAFLCISIVGTYSWHQARRYRRVPWWHPILSEKDVLPDGHRHFRRFIILFFAGALTVIATIVLQGIARGY
jgi:hypothetical protein